MPSPPPGYVGFLGRLRLPKNFQNTAVSFTPTPAHRYASNIPFPGSHITLWRHRGLWTTLACSMRPPAAHYMLCSCNQVRLRRFLLTVTRQAFASQPHFGRLFALRPVSFDRLPQFQVLPSFRNNSFACRRQQLCHCRKRSIRDAVAVKNNNTTS